MYFCWSKLEECCVPMRSNGETGRKLAQNLDEIFDDEGEMANFLEENGGNRLNWEEELQRRRDAKKQTTSSSPSSSIPEVRTSRNASKNRESEIELQWMELIRKQDQKKLKSKKDQAADAKEFRLQELANDKLRLEIESKKWDVFAKRFDALGFGL